MELCGKDCRPHFKCSEQALVHSAHESSQPLNDACNPRSALAAHSRAGQSSEHQALQSGATSGLCVASVGGNRSLSMLSRCNAFFVVRFKSFIACTR